MSDSLSWLVFPLVLLFLVGSVIALTYQLSQGMSIRLPRRVAIGIGAVYLAALLLWGLVLLTNSVSADANLILLLLVTGALFVQAGYPFLRRAPKAPSG